MHTDGKDLINYLKSHKLNTTFRMLSGLLGLIFTSAIPMVIYDIFISHPAFYATYSLLGWIGIFILMLLFTIISYFSFALLLSGYFPKWAIRLIEHLSDDLP